MNDEAGSVCPDHQIFVDPARLDEEDRTVVVTTMREGGLPKIPAPTPPSAYFWRWLERLINKYLCPRPDAKPLWLSQWWYNVTGRMETFCHQKYCDCGNWPED